MPRDEGSGEAVCTVRETRTKRDLVVRGLKAELSRSVTTPTECLSNTYAPTTVKKRHVRDPRVHAEGTCQSQRVSRATCQLLQACELWISRELDWTILILVRFQEPTVRSLPSSEARVIGVAPSVDPAPHVGLLNQPQIARLARYSNRIKSLACYSHRMERTAGAAVYGVGELVMLGQLERSAKSFTERREEV